MSDLEEKEAGDKNGKRPAPRPVPYCPIRAIRSPEGGIRFEAYLVGDIKDVDEYIDLIDVLLTARENDECHLFIDSPGGYVSAGSIIASAIDCSRAKVYTHAVGLCASAACLIHNAVKEGFALVEDFGILMIHMSLHSDMGVSSQIANRACDQVRYVLENLLGQAKDMGYIYEDELDRIQTGENIYISAPDFAKRVEAHRKGVRAEDAPARTDKDDDQFSATESFNVAYEESMRDRCRFIFPNMKMTTHEYNNILSSLDGEECQTSIIMDDGTTMVGTNIPTMAPGMTPEMMAHIRLIKANTLRVRSTDGKNFRIYVPSDLMFSRMYITQLCLFLDSVREDQTVTFVLGAKIADMIACNLGAVISAMRRCRGRIITVAAGYCSIPESILWTYGTERKVLRYGALTFGKTEIVRIVKKYDDYFTAAFRRALEIKILTEADVEELNKFKTKLILRQDLTNDQF